MGNVNGGFLCYECKYCHYDVFGRALCLAKDNFVINGYDKACDDDFDSRYEVSEENNTVLMKKI